MTVAFLRQCNDKEQHALLMAAVDTLELADAPPTEAAPSLLAELDAFLSAEAAGTPIAPGPFVSRLPPEARMPVWAALLAQVKDIHSGIDTLPEEGWKLLEAIVQALNIPRA